MPDREKVIKSLESFVGIGSIKWSPHRIDESWKELQHLLADALELLKEQEDEKPVLDEFGRCFLNALKRQLDMKLQVIELLIAPEFAEKIVELIEKMFD